MAIKNLSQADAALSTQLLLTLCRIYTIAADLASLERTARRCLGQALRHKLEASALWARYFLGSCYYLRNELPQAVQRYLDEADS